MRKILGLVTIFALMLGLAAVACDSGTDDDNNNDGKDVVLVTDTGTPGEDGTGGEEDTGDGPCVPACDGKACGDDGCGGSCGACPPGVVCNDLGQCPCTADCDTTVPAKECGPDGCGGYCGTGDVETKGCTAPDVCQDDFTCEPPCVPNCDGKECGSDECGGSCGSCPCDGCDPEAIECVDSMCAAAPDCDCGCIYECFGTCPEGDSACYQNCINSATIEGQMAYNNLSTCLDQSGAFDCPEGDDDCWNEAFDQCMDEYYECFHGDVECVDMYLCIISCPSGEAGTICAQECFGSGTADANKTWSAFIDCIDVNGYFDCPDNDDACVQEAWDACNEEFRACAHGDLTCGETFDCMDNCAPTDQICGLSCQVHGSVEAQEQFDGIVDCIVEQCGEDVSAECENSALEGACSAVYNDCIGS